MKKHRWVLIFGLAVLFTACMIFFFSAQEGSASAKTSEGFVRFLLRLVRPDFDSLNASERNKLLASFQRVVRKIAHFTEFALLGAFLYWLFTALKYRRRAALSWLAGTLYACTDEWHQMFVGQRAASWVDVGIDSGGVLFGVLLALLIVLIRRRKRASAGSAG